MGKKTEQKATDGFLYRLTNPPQFQMGESIKMEEVAPAQQINIPPNIDNSTLHAGSAMIFYCQDCGWPSDIKHEGYFLRNPRKRCTECKVMKKKGWLEKAKIACKTLVPE